MHQGTAGPYTVYYRNQEEFLRLVDEVFVREEYRFETSSPKPFIIDCGSHIGMSILYFKSKYPDATIIGFEPNPDNFLILQKNLAANHITGVKITNAALSSTAGTAILKTSKEDTEPWTWGDTIIDNLRGDDSVHRKVTVKTIKLSDYITGPVDFIKIDVEGSEQAILTDIQGKMSLVQKIALEFHDTPTGRAVNNFDTVIELLRNGGFDIETTSRNEKIVFADFAKHMRHTFGYYCIKCAIRANKTAAK